MKVLCTFLIIANSFFLSNNKDVNQKKGTELGIKATLRGCYSFSENYNSTDSMYYFLIEVKLINNTYDQIEFLTHSCTPVGNLVLESENYKICVNNCRNNQNIPIKLKPGQEFSIPLLLKANKRNANCYIKIGWALLTKENTKSIDNYLKVLEKAKTKYENVIWSNQFYLDTAGGQPIDIK
jgi:hypothetical protein